MEGISGVLKNDNLRAREMCVCVRAILNEVVNINLWIKEELRQEIGFEKNLN